ncbi:MULTISPECIES: cytochrome d ubiquinol oxidase subunit II [Ralstonia solanacearum species complex]|nr:cytochrome d ubiquinol oxidase subunit II [Ralstonia solanacearum]MDN4064507.1 cytochrome d ubiquinol oxidase subunit II [Ralstonia solanacearum]NUU72131.1 hypothetical protein [Ralstonia solanacearum]QHB58847.1 hypothetical protein GRD98_06950 [Ralstonia solanacearum]
MTASTRHPLLISDHALQQTVGWIALLMPVTVRVFALAFDHIWTTNSISAYYYTSLRDVFVGSLAVGGLVLAFFRTGHPRDRWVTISAGVSAIGIGLFPMGIIPSAITPQQAATPDAEARLIDALQHGPHGPLGYHFYFVGAFFLLAFYLVTFGFRVNTPANPTPQKRRRNWVYVICGCLMGFAFGWIAMLWLLGGEASIFWPETLAVMSFAGAWLVKGQLVLKDQPSRSPELHGRQGKFRRRWPAIRRYRALHRQ